jgi:hypothetical protein
LKNQYNIRDILENNLILKKCRVNIEKLDVSNEDSFVLFNLIGKWLNRFYFRKKIKNITEGKESYEIVESSSVDLSGLNMKLEGIKILFFMIGHNNSLEDMDLKMNGIEEETFKLFKYAIRKSKPLKRLSLEGNNFASVESISLFVSFFPKINKLIMLNVCEVGLDENSVKNLADNLKIFQNLEVLFLDRNKLNSFGAGYLLDALKHNPKINYLSLSETSIDATLVSYFNRFISICSLNKLNLNCNNLGNKFFHCLSQLALSSMRILNIDLQNCLILDDGLNSLATGIVSNKHILSLDLSFNNFTYHLYFI